MLIVLPTTPMTQNASQYLAGENISHQVIDIPESLGYKTGSDIAIYLDSDDVMDVPMKLSRAHFIVMRVFKEFRQ